MHRAAWIALASGVAAAAVVTIMAGPARAGSRPRSAVRLGDWGGEHVAMTVKARGAKLDFDCAHGEITQPLRPDRRGRFQARGVYVPEHGGPQRIDEETTDGKPARYSGRIEGGVLTLTVEVGDPPQPAGTYTLRHGRTPVVTKCL